MVVEWLKRLQRDNYFEALKEYIENLRMFYIHHFSIFDYDNASNNITLSEVHNSLQDTKKMLSQVEQSLDKQNKNLSEYSTAILENKIKLSEMRQLLSQVQILIEKNITTTHSEFANIFSNNL
uniref:Uncharacterized protein n=1 Tax=Meloidogyne enterolobii TaxID=390850 RepID=A0A6V7X0H7_MELEN|nr:unnamed protein product [Meloidogyne enterolobii]